MSYTMTYQDKLRNNISRNIHLFKHDTSCHKKTNFHQFTQEKQQILDKYSENPQQHACDIGNWKNSTKRVLTCENKYIQSSLYANIEAPRQEWRDPNIKIHPFIQFRPPKIIAKISQERMIQSKWWWSKWFTSLLLVFIYFLMNSI